ncbi:MAG: hypothetical protein WCH99_10175 [Verrucomicrobiota bacterium]
MSLQKYQPQSAIPTDAKDAVRFWDNLAAQFARGSVASQVMCGFALLELRETANVKRGGDHKSEIKPEVFGFDSWEDFIEANFGMSDDTARNRMNMAKGVKSDFKKLGLGDRFRALLATPPSAWSEDDTKMLSSSLAKVTDGLTQTDFFRKLGLAKLAPGNHFAHGKGKRKLSLHEQAEVEKVLVADLMNRVMGDLDTLAGRFTCHTDADCEVFRGALMKHTAAINDWLRMPKNNRQPAFIAALFTRPAAARQIENRKS